MGGVLGEPFTADEKMKAQMSNRSVSVGAGTRGITDSLEEGF